MNIDWLTHPLSNWRKKDDRLSRSRIRNAAGSAIYADLCMRQGFFPKRRG
jgi:hypothetical protein